MKLIIGIILLYIAIGAVLTFVMLSSKEGDKMRAELYKFCQEEGKNYNIAVFLFGFYHTLTWIFYVIRSLFFNKKEDRLKVITELKDCIEKLSGIKKELEKLKEESDIYMKENPGKDIPDDFLRRAIDLDLKSRTLLNKVQELKRRL